MSAAARTILVTGGAGFIGSHVVRRLVRRHPENRIINLDALTYAGHPANVADIAEAPNYRFVQGDIGDAALLRRLFAEEAIDGVIHLAAESHVDRSIGDPLTFARTNVLGTLTLLQAAREAWAGKTGEHLFYHISTDEVYGSLEFGEAAFTEASPYSPHSPYSASKAAADHFVRAFGTTYGLPVIISNCSNNYGPYQFPEKLVPLCIRNICAGKPLPIYGRGENVRDWLHVEDHAAAVDLIFRCGQAGETYNIGGGAELSNLEMVQQLIEITDRLLGRPAGSSLPLITYVPDRAGHDLRYAVDSTKLRRELGWTPQHSLSSGLEATVRWYLDNRVWTETVTGAAFEQYYAAMYEHR